MRKSVSKIEDSGDAPQILSVYPPTWYAGTTVTVTIIGTGFGDAPTVDIEGPPDPITGLPAGIDQYEVISVSDTAIVVTVWTASNAPTGNALISVTSSWPEYSEEVAAVTAMALLMQAPTVTAVTININNSSDNADAIAVNGQTIPAQVILTGAPATVQFSDPTGHVSISAADGSSSLYMTNGVPGQIRIKANNTSAGPNDVQINATIGDNQMVGQATMTVVNLTIPPIYAADTPNAMLQTQKPIYRIPPSVNTPIKVTLEPDLGDSGQYVTLATSGTSTNNGDFTLGGSSTQVAATTIITTTNLQLSGTAQTAATVDGQTVPDDDQTPPTQDDPGGGNAGNLQLVAQVAGNNVVTSNGFSVAAILTGWFVQAASSGGYINVGTREQPDFEEAPPGQVPDFYGVGVELNWDSDSGDVGDLEAVWWMEAVKFSLKQGSLSNAEPFAQRYYDPAFPKPSDEDDHLVPVGYTGPGELVVQQLFLMADRRTGAYNIEVSASGFEITKTLTSGDPGKLKLEIDVKGAQATITSDSGETYMSSAGTVKNSAGDVEPNGIDVSMDYPIITVA